MNAQLQPQPEPGRLILDEPPEVYFTRRLDEASNSSMKVIDRSAAHFKHWVETPDSDEETAALRFGKAFHCATLEPAVFDRTYSILPPDAPQRPTAAMLGAKKRSPESEERCAWWGEWNAENAGRVILSARDYDRARYMADSARAHPVAGAMIEGGRREVTMRWVDEETGVKCKARVDLDNDEMQFQMDLKSCLDASPEGFARAVHSYRYHVQHFHYFDGARACGIKRNHFLFLAVESEAPYVCAPYHIDAHAEERGYELRKRALLRQAECLRTGEWPGYTNTIQELTLPTWAFYN